MWGSSLESQSRQWLLFNFLTAFILKITWAVAVIEHLEGEAGFRMASLQWKYPQPSKAPVSFRVRYCELHQWGLHRCRYQEVGEEENPKTNKRTGRGGEGHVEALGDDVFLIEIGGLRMATNYSFQVVPQDSALDITGQPSQISLQTKGFSAKATKCLGNSSEVLVETGPFFGGRISVDESEKPGCFIQGDPTSAQTKYTLRVEHSDCGSVVNGSKVTTVILVQENLPILTHSTRKFIVLCSFSPESFTVKTGVSLPRDSSVAKSMDYPKLIRVFPQNTNILVADKDQTNHARGRAGLTTAQENGVEIEVADDNLQNLENSTPPILNLSRRQGRAYTGNELESSEQMLKQNEQSEGTWETYLVFGMICMAIVASLSSVGWFINSYRKSSGERLHVEDGDGDSELGSSSSSQVSSTFVSLDDDDDVSRGSSHRSPHNLDTRSELEVELDFEFSEERNPSPFHLQLDLQNHGPTSQA